MWRVFRRYHYLTSGLNSSAQCYCAYFDGEPVAFCAVLHHPHRVINLKRVTRLVVLPDYQGIGIGSKMLQIVARHYDNLGFLFNICTSAKNLIMKLAKGSDFKLLSYQSTHGLNNGEAINEAFFRSNRQHNDTRLRKIATFRFKGTAKKKFNAPCVNRRAVSSSARRPAR